MWSARPELDALLAVGVAVVLVFAARSALASLRGPRAPAIFRRAEAALGLTRDGCTAVGRLGDRRLRLTLPGVPLGPQLRPDARAPYLLTWPAELVADLTRGSAGQRIEAVYILALHVFAAGMGVLMVRAQVVLGAIFLLPHFWKLHDLAPPVLTVVGGAPLEAHPWSAPPRLVTPPLGDPSLAHLRLGGPLTRLLTVLDPDTRALLARHVRAGGSVGPGEEGVRRPLGPDDDPVEVAARIVELAERLDAAAARPVAEALLERATTDPLPEVRVRALRVLLHLREDDARVAAADAVRTLTGGLDLGDALGAGPDVRLAAAVRSADEATPAHLEALRGADRHLRGLLDRAIVTAQARAPAGGGGRLALTDGGAGGSLSLTSPADGGLALARREEEAP